MFSFQGTSLKTQRKTGFALERRSNGVTEPWALDRGEGYGICFDAVGVDWGEGPPVPIPNTEVKLTFADNTLRVTAREDR